MTQGSEQEQISHLRTGMPKAESIRRFIPRREGLIRIVLHSLKISEGRVQPSGRRAGAQSEHKPGRAFAPGPRPARPPANEQAQHEESQLALKILPQNALCDQPDFLWRQLRFYQGPENYRNGDERNSQSSAQPNGRNQTGETLPKGTHAFTVAGKPVIGECVRS